MAVEKNIPPWEKTLGQLAKKHPHQASRINQILTDLRHTYDFLTSDALHDRLTLAGDVLEEAADNYASLFGEARAHRMPLSPEELLKIHDTIFQAYREVYATVERETQSKTGEKVA